MKGLFAVAALLAAAATASAQVPPAPADPQRPASAAEAAKPAPRTTNAFERWVDLQAASFQVRYRDIVTSSSVLSASQGQDSVGIRTRVKFDKAGRYFVGAGIATGNGFTSGWNNMGIGTGDAARAWYLKQLFAGAVPLKGLELSYGGIAPLRGESTEITSWDNDGYLLGERVSVKMPTTMYVDEISFTRGYLGDTTTSSLTDRYHHLDDVNYHHLLVAKRLSKKAGVSGDYTRLSGVGTVRAAFSAKVPGPIVGQVRYEQYQRFGPKPAFGFAASAERTMVNRVTVGGGYADIDANYGGLNGDRFNRGRRLFQTGSIILTRELTASVFLTEAFANSFAVTNNRRFDVILAFNALATLKRYGLVH